MKKLQNLIFALVTCSLLSANYTFARPVAHTGLPSFELSVSQLGLPHVPTLYWADSATHANGKAEPAYQPLLVAQGTRGTLVKIPLTPTIKIYTETSDNQGHEQMKPIIDVPAKHPNQRLLLVLHLDVNGKPTYTFLDDTKQAHPAGTVRVANLSSQRLAFSVNEKKPFIVEPKQNVVATPEMNPEGRFPFRYFSEQSAGATYNSPLKLLRFRSTESRLLVLYTMMPEVVQNSASANNTEQSLSRIFVPVAYRLYDEI